MKNIFFVIFLFLPFLSYSQVVSHSFEDSVLTVFIKSSTLNSETDTIYPSGVPSEIKFFIENLDSSCNCNLVLNTAPKRLTVEFSISNTNNLLYKVREENWEEQLFSLSIQERGTNVKRYNFDIWIVSQSLLKKRKEEELRKINDSITWLENHPKRLAHHQKQLENLRKPQESIIEKDIKKIQKIYSKIIPPNGLKIDSNLYIDMSEMQNIYWFLYINHLKEDSLDAQYRCAFPAKVALTGEHLNEENTLYADLYLDRFVFGFFPVVGLSHEQVLDYCIWRGNRVSKSYTENLQKKYADYEVIVHYRLPTKEEWEYAAIKDDLNKQFGGYSTKRRYTEKEKRKIYRSAKYYVDSTRTLEQVRLDMNNYFESDSGYKQLSNYKADYSLPYFLSYSLLSYNVGWEGIQIPSFTYAYLPTNQFQLYNMFGNVAEMTSEKGIAKGGSFVDTLEECAADKVQKYDSPQAWLGFRCVAEVVVRKKDGK